MRRRFRLNVQLAVETMVLLLLTLGVLTYYSHKVLSEEAHRDANLMLDATVQGIDNILLSVEQATGNVYYDVLEHLDDKQRMYTYCRALVEDNPNIIGCAIAFKPGYFPDTDLFMAYVHRRAFVNDLKSDLVTTETFTKRPYTEQRWYTDPMDKGWIGWTDPLTGEDTENVPMVNFCLPLTDKNGERVGVMAVDVSVSQLSKIILAAKTSENGYAVLIARNGQYIVHPDIAKLENYTVYSHAEEGNDYGAVEAAEAMLAGKVGEKEFKMYGKEWTVFFKPFVRSEWKGRYNGEGTLGWSVGVVLPDEDIFGMHNILVYLVIGIIIISLGFFFLLCTWIIRLKLKPLRMLNEMAQNVAAGDLEHTVAVTSRDDEIGQLQNRFGKMQQSLRKQIDAIERETEILSQRSEMLKTTFGKTEESDRIKSSFLRYMIRQLEVPTISIESSVTTLCNNYNKSTKEEVEKQVNNIRIKNEVVIDLLDNITHFSETNERKEADNV